MLSPTLLSFLTKKIGLNAGAISEAKVIQELWSGYGRLLRISTPLHSKATTFIIKEVNFPSQEATHHPRGWNTSASHVRKLRSYEIEAYWYETYSSRCGSLCRVPRCLGTDKEDEHLFILLEDLDGESGEGFPERYHPENVTRAQIIAVIDWLANLHATFLGQAPKGLWKTGSYWHLDTRQDELAVLQKEDPTLAKVASRIDDALNTANYQTLIHGDAKLANFCFSASSKGNPLQVAAVDFQYVGGGCGMKDLAYFIGSGLDEASCADQESELLDHYFTTLRTALHQHHPSLSTKAIADLEEEWRALYPLAWTDFHRFLKGWSPGHWKINSYSEQLAQKVIAKFNLS